MTDARQAFDLPDGPQGPEELLTAYLFDELDPADRLAVEQRLIEEPALAERLEELRGTLSLLRQASLDAGPGELSSMRRDALRAEAQGVTGAGSELGAMLRFPWLRAAAAVLVVSAGVMVYTQPGLLSPESEYEATGASADMALEPNDESDDANSARGGFESGGLEGLGYRDGAVSNVLPEQTLQERTVDTRDPQLWSATAVEEQEQRSLSQGDLKALSELGYLAGGAPSGTAEQPERSASTASPEPSTGLFFDEAGRLIERSGGEKVLGDYARSEPAFDSFDPFVGGVDPATPASPSTPATPATPPAPGTPAPNAQPEAELGNLALRARKEAVPESLRAELQPVEVADILAGVSGDSLALSGESNFGMGGLGENGERFELGLLTTGYADNLGFALDADNDAIRLFESRLGRYAYVQDGYGRPYHQDQILYHLRPVHEQETPQDMFFRYYGDNSFVTAETDNVSTFAVDVDTASYPLARNYLANNMLPPRSSVRTEEVVNYFDQGLEPPTEDIFTVQLDAAPTPYGTEDGNLLLRVGVKAKEVTREERLPMNLVFVVDKSGSMRKQDRLNLVKRSLELLLDQVRDDDKIGVVSFDTNGHVVQESVAGSERWQVREALRTLSADGSTNAAEGLFLGYEMLDRNFIEGGINRLVLASDGVANTGETDQQRILDQVADFTARQVDLTTIGVGMGNHNDVFLEQLANQGNGSCHYVDGFDEAKRVFLDEFSSTMQTVARDVKIQVEFDESRIAKWRQIGYENRALTAEQFRDDSVDAGEVGAGHEIVALYELELASEADLMPTTGIPAPLATVRMRWMPDPAFLASMVSVQKAGVPDLEELDVQVQERSWDLSREQVQSDWSESPSHFRLAAVAAQYAEYLRRSYHVRGDSYDRLEADASQLVVELAQDEKVRELRDLIRRTRDLVRYREPGSELWKLIEESRRITMLQQELRNNKNRNTETEELLVELLQQNQKLEERIREHLEDSGK